MLKFRRGSVSFSTHTTVPCGLGSGLGEALAQFWVLLFQVRELSAEKRMGTFGK